MEEKKVRTIPFLADKIEMLGERVLIECRFVGKKSKIILGTDDYVPLRENYPFDGEVVAIGDEVEKIKVGDRVAWGEVAGYTMKLQFEEEEEDDRNFLCYYLILHERDIRCKILVPLGKDQIPQKIIVLRGRQKEPTTDAPDSIDYD